MRHHYDIRPLRPQPPRCSCGGIGELRHCDGNNGVAWRCPHCLKCLSPWLPHKTLRGVYISQLPPWDSAPSERTAQGRLFR